MLLRPLLIECLVTVRCSQVSRKPLFPIAGTPRARPPRLLPSSVPPLVRTDAVIDKESLGPQQAG